MKKINTYKELFENHIAVTPLRLCLHYVIQMQYINYIFIILITDISTLIIHN